MVELMDTGADLKMNITNEDTRRTCIVTQSGISDMFLACNYLPDVHYKNCPRCGYPKITIMGRFCVSCRSMWQDETAQIWYPGIMSRDK